jgi:hypothetical protein
VQSDPDANRPFTRPRFGGDLALGIDRGQHGCVRVSEGDEERVAPRAEREPAVNVPHGSQDLVVSRDQCGVRIAQ